MQTIIIRYLESVVDGEGKISHVLVGAESYEGIKEALIPAMPRPKPGKVPHPVFLTKCFADIDHHVWRLENVTAELTDGQPPAVYHVYIKRHDISKEEFLYQTLKKNPATTISKLLRQGTLVEVDYGFVQQTARSTAELKTNKRYMDTLLDAEMHKRRLAVVVKVISKNLIQVAPITSQSAADGDRTIFKLEQDTLDKMPRYKHSGKDSHVICSMLESVSIQRVLPPTSYFKNTTGRNPNYGVALSRGEIRTLKESLVHAVGASDYVPFNEVVLERKSVQERDASIVQLNEQLAAAQAKVDELMAIERMAKRWTEEMGRNFAEEVEFQHDLDREDGLK
ncbi:hypothetical protein ACIQAL_26355 [Pseudomonas sp. NPDC088368]|jgi:uncharacterized protein YifN (PemK superfamily)|uniref:hypothetical protein n=1 Tax=Pseudomonas sp. NPDC088368 TaxID=3364453 RepID=UPI0037F7EE91